VAQDLPAPELSQMLPRHIYKQVHIVYTRTQAPPPHYAAACTTLKPSDTVLEISSFLCGSSPSANATSCHCRSVSHRANRAASFSASCFACLSCLQMISHVPSIASSCLPGEGMLTFSTNPSRNRMMRRKLSSSIRPPAL